MNDEVYFSHADKHRKGDSIILGERNQACPKYPKRVCISLQYLHKSIGDEVDLLPADKHNNFLQGDSITLGARSQTGP